MNPTIIIIAIVLLALVGGFYILMRGAGEDEEDNTEAVMETRLARLDLDIMPQNYDEEILAQPFKERILQPFLERIVKLVTRFTQAEQLRNIQAMLLLAGSEQNPGSFLVMKMVGLVIGGAVGLGLAFEGGMSGIELFMIPVGGVLLGYYFPTMSLKSKIKKRKQEIVQSLPNVLDLLTICMEAGQTFESALQKVCEKYNDFLSKEFARVLVDIRLGRPRRDALLAMADRNEVEELTSFLRAIIQSESLGVGMSEVLKVQAAEIRRARRQRAQEAGAKAPIKMMLPMVGCIFPTIFIILLGPAVITIIGQYTAGK